MAKKGSKLSADERRQAILIYISGKSTKETANELGRSKEAVLSLIRRYGLDEDYINKIAWRQAHDNFLEEEQKRRQCSFLDLNWDAFNKLSKREQNKRFMFAKKDIVKDMALNRITLFGYDPLDSKEKAELDADKELYENKIVDITIGEIESKLGYKIRIVG